MKKEKLALGLAALGAVAIVAVMAFSGPVAVRGQADRALEDCGPGNVAEVTADAYRCAS